MEFIAYKHIKRLAKNHLGNFTCSDNIVIQEKVDGANISIRYDIDKNAIRIFSRNRELDGREDSRGAYEWAQTLDVDKVKNILGTRYIAYADWLSPHTVVYPEGVKYSAYFFDVYDIENDKWLHMNDAKKMIEAMGLKFVPVFYEGNFISWEHVYEFVGKTELGGDIGEGVVVKNMTKLNNPNDNQPYFVKIVGDKFCEVHNTKKQDTAGINERVRIQNIVASVVTEARVRKILHKMVDDNIIPENWGEKDLVTINKNIARNVYYDCLKEEQSTVNEVGKLFGSIASTVAKEHVKTILKTK